MAVNRPRFGAAGPQRLEEDLAEVALLFDLRLLAAEVAEVVQLGAANCTAADNLNVVDDRGVYGERTLNADLEADLANAERLANAFTRATDDNTLENLDTRARTFDDVDVNLDGVAGAEIWNVVAQ